MLQILQESKVLLIFFMRVHKASHDLAPHTTAPLPWNSTPEAPGIWLPSGSWVFQVPCGPRKLVPSHAFPLLAFSSLFQCSSTPNMADSSFFRSQFKYPPVSAWCLLPSLRLIQFVSNFCLPFGLSTLLDCKLHEGSDIICLVHCHIPFPTVPSALAQCLVEGLQKCVLNSRMNGKETCATALGHSILQLDKSPAVTKGKCG